MRFITRNDLLVAIREQHLDQLADDETGQLIDQAEAQAISCIEDHLIQRYDLGSAFEQSEEGRSATLVRWIVLITVYLIYERADEGQRPEWLEGAYKMTMQQLGLIQEGKRSVNLPLLVDSQAQPITQIRTGSLPRRSHGF